MEALAIAALVAAAGTVALVALPLIRRRRGKNRTRTSEVVDWPHPAKTKNGTNTKKDTKATTRAKTSVHAYEDPVLESKYKEQLAYETAEIKALADLRNEFTLDPPAKPEELVAHEKTWEATLAQLTRKSKRKTKSKRPPPKNNNNGFDEGTEANQYKMKFRRATRKRSMRQ